MTARYISATNPFVPAATGQAIAYVRDPKKFKINQYVQMIRSPKPVGLYAQLDIDQPSRVVTDGEWAWEDGDERPKARHNQGNFEWVEFRCFRRAYPWTIGYQALEAAEGWNPQAFHNAIVLQQAMTNRTFRIVTMLETTALWGGSTADANVLNDGAGNWTTASGEETDPNYLAIKKSLLEAVRRIVLKTGGAVAAEDLQLVVSPGLALAMANTSEINSFLKQSRFALDQVRGGKAGQNDLWGLPDQYAGLPIVVEDAVRTNVRANSAGTPATIDTQKIFIKADTSAVITSRPGGLDGVFGSPSYSTVQCYFYKHEMEVQAFDDPKNLRHECSVVEQFAEKLAAPPSGFLITATA